MTPGIGIGRGIGLNNNRASLFGGSNAPSYLLDTYTGAAAAYSLRQLRTGVTSVVRVRRSSDDAEANFTAAEVSDGTLTTWTGANDGFVVTWYDQSGNSRHQTQATLSYQIQIIDSGSLITDPITGKPAINGGTIGLGMDSTAFSMSQPVTYFAVTHRPASGSNYILIGSSNSTARLQITELITNSGECAMLAGLTFNPSYSASENRFDTTSLIYALFNTTNSELGVNGVAAATGSVGTYSSDNIRIGSPGGGSVGFGGYLSEIIVYASDKSADRAAIESAINSHYSIY